MILNEDLFELEIPVVNTQNELTVDEIEDNIVTTPEENGVAAILMNSISDTWDNIQQYNSAIATIADTNIENSDKIITVLQDIVNDENKNAGRLVAALGTITSDINNIDVGEQEAEMKLTESLDEDKIELMSDILGKDLSTSDENYIYDNWRAFYNDPEMFRDTVIVDLVNQGLDNGDNGLENFELDSEELDSEDEYEDDEDMEDQVVIDDDFIKESLSEDIQKIEKKPYRLGTIRYDANEGRKKRIDYYRKLANVDEDVPLTEGALKKWAVDRVACFTNTTPERVKSELLGNKWSEFEEG